MKSKTRTGRRRDLGPGDTFVGRHVGPREADIEAMLRTLGLSSLDELTDNVVPADIRLDRPLEVGPEGRGEHELLESAAPTLVVF